MTKTYMIHAWCIRPFITVLDIEAKTPEQAIAIARRQQQELLDAAEECNGKYPWDEFAAYDESGNELLHILVSEAPLRDAAPELLEALERAVSAQGNHILRNGDGMLQDLTPGWVVLARAVIASVHGRLVYFLNAQATFVYSIIPILNHDPELSSTLWAHRHPGDRVTPGSACSVGLPTAVAPCVPLAQQDRVKPLLIR